MTMILDEDDARREVESKVESRQWWIFVGSSPLLEEVESRHYAGTANVDFQVMLGPPVGPFVEVFPDIRMLLLAFARKNRMDAADLVSIIRSFGDEMTTAADLEEQDIIFAYAAARGIL